MRRLLLLLSIVFSVPGFAYAEFDYSMEAPAVSEYVYAIITPTRDLPNAEKGGWNSNSALVVTDSGVLLFDSGSSEFGGQCT